MLSILNKKFVTFILVFFAFLQMIAPLNHGHIETDSAQVGYGIHMHMLEIVQGGEKLPTFKNHTSSLHTIGVDEALVKDLNQLVLPIFAVLFFIFILSATTNYCKPAFNFLPPASFYLRLSSRPRAPPKFF